MDAAQATQLGWTAAQEAPQAAGGFTESWECATPPGAQSPRKHMEFSVATETIQKTDKVY